MLCNISAAREMGHENADVPLHLYGPPGVARFLAAAMELSDTYLLCPVIIHELALGPVPGRDAAADVRALWIAGQTAHVDCLPLHECEASESNRSNWSPLAAHMRLPLSVSCTDMNN